MDPQPPSQVITSAACPTAPPTPWGGDEAGLLREQLLAIMRVLAAAEEQPGRRDYLMGVAGRALDAVRREHGERVRPALRLLQGDAEGREEALVGDLRGVIPERGLKVVS